jgi:hypothetical protein
MTAPIKTRRRLPNRHGHELFSFEHDGIEIAASLLLQRGCHKALTRNCDGSASGPLARALDLVA